MSSGAHGPARSDSIAEPDILANSASFTRLLRAENKAPSTIVTYSKAVEPSSVPGRHAYGVDLQVGQSLQHLIHEGSLGEPPKALHPVMRDDEMRGSPRAGDLLETCGDVGRLHSHEIGAEVDRVVDRLLEIATPIGTSLLPPY